MHPPKTKLPLFFALACFVLTSADALAAAKKIDWHKEQQFWAFKQPQTYPLPPVKLKGWPRQPIDHFILARLEQKGLKPSLEANKTILIRRLSYDLTGLPPTRAQVTAFLNDKTPQAYENLVEGLLNSPRFGERLASMWLPLARYAEDQAHQVGDDTKAFYPNAYKYRDWVIHAFNEDLPYNDFLTLQLAADLADEPQPQHMAALGFMGLGPKYYDRGRIQVMAEEWEDRVDTFTRTTLGMTVACARCHDHKFEPITMQDYYGMAGVFASLKLVNKTPDGRKQTNSLSADKVESEMLHVVEDGTPQDLHVFLRGNPDRKGPVAERRFLRALSPDEPEPFKKGSGRKEMAELVASEKNPLTARVYVNRVWAQFFGRGLVSTPSNFGHSGDLPTHPELLDDLAVRFMENGWSTKKLVREIVLSSTYRQTSSSAGSNPDLDAANQFLWRMNRRRATIEQWRDSLLFVTGELDLKGGKSLELSDPKNLRRTVHARVSRLELDDLLMLFDYPDANVHAEQRSVTTTATQKLYMLNSPFVLARAESLAAKGRNKPSKEVAHSLYQQLYGRAPSTEELRAGLEFLTKRKDTGMPRLQRYAQALLISNEFLYVD